MKRLQLYMSTHKQFEHTQHQHPLLPGMDPASGGQSIKEKKKKKTPNRHLYSIKKIINTQNRCF